ncbi:MAG: hypothetical protein Q4D42_11845 [Eubacteriales bacterium]|nr:hypothetical protein [Eubacteriales bacterium]
MTLLFPIWCIAHCISRLAHLPTMRMMVRNDAYYFALIINIIGLILGFLMICHPMFSLLSVGYIVSLYLILLGIDSIAIAFSGVGSRK